MHARRTRGQCDVNAVIDDQRDVARAQQVAHGQRLGKEGPGVGALVAQLHQRDAARHRLLDRLHQRQARGIAAVGDEIEPERPAQCRAHVTLRPARIA